MLQTIRGNQVESTEKWPLHSDKKFLYSTEIRFAFLSLNSYYHFIYLPAQHMSSTKITSTFFPPSRTSLQWEIPGLYVANPDTFLHSSFGDSFNERSYLFSSLSLPKLHSSITVPPQSYQPRVFHTTQKTKNPFNLDVATPLYVYTQESNIPSSLSLHEANRFRAVIKNCSHPLTYVPAYCVDFLINPSRNLYDTCGCSPGGPLAIGAWIYIPTWDHPVQITRILEIDRKYKKLTLEIVSEQDRSIVDHLRVDACYYRMTTMEWHIYWIQQYRFGRKVVALGLTVVRCGKIGLDRIRERLRRVSLIFVDSR